MRLAALLVALPLAAQSVRVYSEFQRPGPFGGVVAADRAERPREILSPAVARSAWASFHVAVTPRPGETAFVHVQQNPDLFPVTLYRERFVKIKGAWVPDALEKVDLPAAALLQPDVPEQTTVAFWLDLWVPATAPAERVRVEVVVQFGDQWVVYPMEVRVTPALVPARPLRPATLPGPAARTDRFACAAGGKGDSAATVRGLIYRNAQQDRALAGAKVAWEKECAAGPTRGAEWYLKLRDGLLAEP